jgi:hypothetical protein
MMLDERRYTHLQQIAKSGYLVRGKKLEFREVNFCYDQLPVPYRPVLKARRTRSFKQVPKIVF